jgi:hypothetical protein
MSWDHGIKPMEDHYDCRVDLFVDVGHLNEAKKNILHGRKFKTNALVGCTLFNACRIHLNMQIGEHATKHVLEFEPKDFVSYIS